MKTITRDVYTFDELNDSAKEKAREWWREGAFDFEWWDFVYEDFVRICEVLGVEIDERETRSVTGKPLKRHKIWFSGFWSQGDGASFEGAYRYKKGSCAAIREYAPKDEELHRIADTLRDLQRVVFYDAYITIRTNSSNYCHANTMTAAIDSYAEVAWPQISSGAFFPSPFQEKMTEDFLDVLRDLAYWLYKTLENEYEWLMSDEQVDDSIRANEYQFTESGNRSFTI